VNFRSLRFRVTAWYAGLLTLSLLLFGASVYLGLEHYLDSALRKDIAKEARSIGDTILEDVDKNGEKYVIEETAENFAPEINGRFIRITRQDGTPLYQSSMPKDGLFNPARVSATGAPWHSASYRRELVGRTTLVLYHYQYSTSAGKRFLVEVGAPYQEIARVLHGLVLILALGTPIVVALAVAGGYWMMRRALQPVNEIAAQAERLGYRNLKERLPLIASGDEIERLSLSLNRMISRLDNSFQHINRFSADVSHELRTPLTILRGELETIVAERRLSTEHMEIIGSALEEIDRLSKIIDQLLAISRLDAGEGCREVVRLNLGVLALSTADQLRLLADEKSISLVFDIVPGVEVEADQIRLRQVVANLLDNAIKYTPNQGLVKLSVSALGRMAILQVEDNGVGIAAAALPHIFERFYRSDVARSRSTGGSGLGLAIVKAICTAHGADVKVSSTEGRGSCFLVEWPLAIDFLRVGQRISNPARSAVTNAVE
jgi:two-component system, OmpR family, sensor kinase